VRSVKTEELG